MKKIVNIAYYGNRPVVIARPQIRKEPAAASQQPQGGQTPNKGVLLQFPRASQGPLFAAALASAAILLSLVPAIHI